MNVIKLLVAIVLCDVSLAATFARGKIPKLIMDEMIESRNDRIKNEKLMTEYFLNGIDNGEHFFQSSKPRDRRSAGRNNELPLETHCEPLGYDARTDESMTSVSGFDGTIWLGALLPLYNAAMNVNHQTGIMLYEALQFAIADANNASSLPYDWKFALRRVMPTLSTIVGSGDNRQYFGNCFFSNVLFSIGPNDMSSTDEIDRFSETFHLPFVSLSSTSEEREINKDFDTREEGYVRTTFDYSYQMSVADEFWYTALRDLILKLQWNYITTLQSKQYWKEADHFRRLLLEKGLCSGERLDFSPKDFNDEILAKTISGWAFDKRMNVLVLFTSQRDTRRMLKAFKSLKLQGRFVLVFAQTILDSDVSRGYEEIVLGALSLRPLEEENADFRDYFLKLTPTTEKTAHFHRFWEDVFKCNLNSSVLDKDTSGKFPRVLYSRRCNGSEKLTTSKGYRFTPGTSAIINTIRLVAQAITEAESTYPYPCNHTDLGPVGDKLWLRKCPWTHIRDLRKTFNYHLNKRAHKFRNLKFPFVGPSSFFATFEIINFQYTKQNRYENVAVGHWLILTHPDLTAREVSQAVNAEILLDTAKILWSNNSRDVIPMGNCSELCKVGHVTVVESDLRTYRCCWKCAKCPSSHIVVNNTCEPCRFDEKPNSMMDICQPLPVNYTDLTSPVALLVMTLSILGMVFVFFVVFIFIKHNDKHVVRASGRDLSYSILAGTGLLFSCPFLYIRVPTPVVCVLRATIPSLSLLVMFAAMFMKNLRLFRIFVRRRTKLKRPQLISPVSQIIIVCGIGMLQFSFSGIWFFHKSPDSEKVLSDNGEFITLQCVGDEMRSKFFINCTLAITSIMACSCLAYRTRNDLPKNYNESRFIGITAFLTTATFIVFSMVYVASPRSDYYYHEFGLCFFLILVGFYTGVGLFGSRLWILLRGKPFEECHDSIRSRPRSLTPKSPVKECNMNEYVSDVK